MFWIDPASKCIQSYMNNDSTIRKGDTMKQFTSRILCMTILVGLILISLSCSRNPTNATQILLDQAEDGVVIRLVGEGENGLWRLKDDQNDIEVKRVGDNKIAIEASIAQVGEVNTLIKMTPGEIIVLAGMGNRRTISLECPPN